MRVLLPLRKSQANKQSSNSSLSDLEEEGYLETVSTASSDNEQTSPLLVASPPQQFVSFELPVGQSALVNSELQLEQQEQVGVEQQAARSQPSQAARKGAWKTTGLNNPSEAVTGNSPLIRKRRAFPEEEECKLCIKRSALDRKPAARNLSMVSGGRRTPAWSYRNDDSRRDSPVSASDDFKENSPASARGDVQNDVQDLDFSATLKKHGLEIREQEGDGNCLFRAISLQVYGDSSMHSDVRKQCMDFMDRDKEHFSQFVTGEPFEQYIFRKRQDGVHGNNPEIQAISELFNRPVEVFCPENGATPINIFHAEYKTDDAPIRLSYHDGNHYNAVVNPLVPTAGLGLGLPGLQPGLADKMQVAKAVAESDAAADQAEFKRALKESQDDELQRAIKESKLSAEHMYSNEALALSDMDATYFELEQAALEQSLRSSNLEQGKKQKASSEVAPSSINDGSSPQELTSSAHAVASLPSCSDANEARIPPVAAAVASVPSVASASVAAKRVDSPPTVIRSVDEYPQTVQELVMNGFELSKVVRAYELIGGSFDDLLSYLMSNTS